MAFFGTAESCRKRASSICPKPTTGLLVEQNKRRPDSSRRLVSFTIHCQGALAQRSEQATHNRLVPGSNPGGPISSRRNAGPAPWAKDPATPPNLLVPSSDSSPEGIAHSRLSDLTRKAAATFLRCPGRSQGRRWARRSRSWGRSCPGRYGLLPAVRPAPNRGRRNAPATARRSWRQ